MLRISLVTRFVYTVCARFLGRRKTLTVTVQAIDTVLVILLAVWSVVTVSFLAYLWRMA
jgi:hypothetical protein